MCADDVIQPTGAHSGGDVEAIANGCKRKRTWLIMWHRSSCEMFRLLLGSSRCHHHHRHHHHQWGSINQMYLLWWWYGVIPLLTFCCSLLQSISFPSSSYSYSSFVCFHILSHSLLHKQHFWVLHKLGEKSLGGCMHEWMCMYWRYLSIINKAVCQYWYNLFLAFHPHPPPTSVSLSLLLLLLFFTHTETELKVNILWRAYMYVVCVDTDTHKWASQMQICRKKSERAREEEKKVKRSESKQK